MTILLANAESLIQLSVVLNFAYFSFRELRSPTIGRLGENHNQLTALGESIYVRMISEDLEPTWEYAKYREELQLHRLHLKQSNEAAEGTLNEYDSASKLLSISAAIVGLLVLIYIVFEPALEYSYTSFTILLFVLLSPTLFTLYRNLKAPGFVTKIETEREEIRANFNAIDVFINESVEYKNTYLRPQLSGTDGPST